MNLAKLFDMQRELGKVGLFAYKGEDRFNKLVLALLVELGECANEWRGFKFWSKDQEPRVAEMIRKQHENPNILTAIIEYKNPLLEEYVDALHFILELGIEEGFDHYHVIDTNFKYKTLEEQFSGMFFEVVKFQNNSTNEHYLDIIKFFYGLGEMLGFTWEQIEQAYFEKNKVNHQRQEEGY